MAIVPINRVAAYARSAGFTGGSLITIIAICGAESGYNDHARALTLFEDSRGLAQINVYAHPWGKFINLYNGATNLGAAYRVYREAGYSFRPWSTYIHGTYRAFWSASVAAAQTAPNPQLPPPPVLYGTAPQDVPDDYSSSVRGMDDRMRLSAGRLDGWAKYVYAIPY